LNDEAFSVVKQLADSDLAREIIGLVQSDAPVIQERAALAAAVAVAQASAPEKPVTPKASVQNTQVVVPQKPSRARKPVAPSSVVETSIEPSKQPIQEAPKPTSINDTAGNAMLQEIDALLGSYDD
jgi:hypothetical protein